MRIKKWVERRSEREINYEKDGISYFTIASLCAIRTISKIQQASRRLQRSTTFEAHAVAA
jgi:hypothetical protein